MLFYAVRLPGMRKKKGSSHTHCLQLPVARRVSFRSSLVSVLWPESPFDKISYEPVQWVQVTCTA
jgi:hypothetical protein